MAALRNRHVDEIDVALDCADHCIAERDEIAGIGRLLPMAIVHAAVAQMQAQLHARRDRIDQPDDLIDDAGFDVAER